VLCNLLSNSLKYSTSGTIIILAQHINHDEKEIVDPEEQLLI
jgi:signal transduction histidine kinase